MRCSGYVPLGGDPEEDQDRPEGLKFPGWPGKRLGIPPEAAGLFCLLVTVLHFN